MPPPRPRPAPYGLPNAVERLTGEISPAVESPAVEDFAGYFAEGGDDFENASENGGGGWGCAVEMVGLLLNFVDLREYPRIVGELREWH